MKCPNCGTESTDLFCPGCGTELNQSAVASEIKDATVAAPELAPAPALAAILATLVYGDRSFPLQKGAKFLIAREGTDKCTPDLAIASDKISSTPVEVTVNDDGSLTIRDTGTSTGARVVKFLNPGESIDAKPGEMIMLGDELITIT